MPRVSPAPPGRPRAAAAVWLIAFGAWLVLLRLAARIDPAAVQLLLAVTAAAAIYLTLGNSPRRPGQLSAYSVFNPNCAPLLGQLRAEQFDQEVRHRPTYVRSPGPFLSILCLTLAWCSECDEHMLGKCRVDSGVICMVSYLALRF
jgi:hypothetical protein